MSELKVGDRVVLVNVPDNHTCAHLKEKAGVISYMYDTEVNVRFDNSLTDQGGMFSHRFVLEELYNSPLYQALK